MISKLVFAVLRTKRSKPQEHMRVHEERRAESVCVCVLKCQEEEGRKTFMCFTVFGESLRLLAHTSSAVNDVVSNPIFFNVFLFSTFILYQYIYMYMYHHHEKR